jgi:HK97 gp10 family phage protein
MNGFDYKSYMKKIEKQFKAENRKLVAKAAAVVLKEAKRILSSPSGDAPQSITGNLKAGLKKEVKGTYARIGVKAARGAVKSDGERTAAHAWLVEHGHDIIAHKAGKGIKVGETKPRKVHPAPIGEAKPHPFLSTAFENTKAQVKAILSEQRDL